MLPRQFLRTPAILAIAALLLASCGLVGGPAAPADFPTRPITLVVGFGTGGGADVMARALAEAAQTTLPQPLVVENRPGGGGTESNAYVAGRPADGYTLLFGHAGSTILTPTIAGQPGLKWDQFEPIARIHAEEEWLMVHPDAPWDTIEELIEHARANPNTVRVAGSAVGGIDSFVILTLQKEANVEFQYIPFDGGGPAQLAFLGGDAEVLVGNVSEFFQQIEAGTMVPIAVASEERSSIFPEVPTLKEQGWDVVLVQWRSIFAPRGTPQDRIEYLADAFRRAMEAESWKEFNMNTKAVDLYAGPDDFRAFLAAEDERFTALIRELGLGN